MSPKTKESKKIATYSLVIMGVGFIATIPFQGSIWIDLLQGGFEAGLVGGLADWFAVTALFRHPLGLRIPHTALLPNNRQRVTNALVSMLKNDWLSKESIQDKVKQISFTNMLIPLVKKEIEKERFKKTISKLLRQAIEYVEVEKITPFIKKQLEMTISNLDLKKLLDRLSSVLLKEQVDEKALDYVLREAETWLSKEETSRRLGAVTMNVLSKVQVDGVLQFALKSIQSLLNEEKMGNIVKNLLMSGIKSLKHAEEPNRKALIQYIRKQMIGMSENQQLVSGVEKWREKLLANWEPDEQITDTLSKIKQNIIEIIESDDFIERYLMPMTQYLLEKVGGNQEAIDSWIKVQIAILVERNHSQIGNLVQENLDKLDTETLIDMVENNVGKDLQWIRVNGAVCGFIIGIILTAIHGLISLV